MANLALYLVIAIALIFDFVNGFHDAANSIATIVATRVLKPWQAVLWAAFWNFIAFLVLPLEVANAIAKIVVGDGVISIGLVFAGLMGAIFWNVLTAWLGLPSSSSHALIGGMVGAGIAKSGGHVVNLVTLKKTAVFIIYSPLIGMVLGFSLVILIAWLVHRIRAKRAVNKTFRGLQLVSAAAFSLGHGANDAQKTMGIIAALLIGAGKLDLDLSKNPEGIPTWIVLSCHAAIGLGTMFGGWKIVKTMGTKLTRLEPMGGVCAESAAAATLFFASLNGIPVSTTHTITGAIVGVGSANRMSAVRWNVARRVVWAWVLTIPGSAAVAVLSYWLVEVLN
ncbi:MAG TPA: inorganic phosphate transporter [Ilumatobacteraceae bacterium]|nr:inorganic phosphate transporter [Ilumatobacteraceae bacterium]